jgi:hypothetical protein
MNTNTKVKPDADRLDVQQMAEARGRGDVWVQQREWHHIMLEGPATAEELNAWAETVLAPAHSWAADAINYPLAREGEREIWRALVHVYTCGRDVPPMLGAYTLARAARAAGKHARWSAARQRIAGDGLGPGLRSAVAACLWRLRPGGPAVERWHDFWSESLFQVQSGIGRALREERELADSPPAAIHRCRDLRGSLLAAEAALLSIVQDARAWGLPSTRQSDLERARARQRPAVDSMRPLRARPVPRILGGTGTSGAGSGAALTLALESDDEANKRLGGGGGREGEGGVTPPAPLPQSPLQPQPGGAEAEAEDVLDWLDGLMKPDAPGG